MNRYFNKKIHKSLKAGKHLLEARYLFDVYRILRLKDLLFSESNVCFDLLSISTLPLVVLPLLNYVCISNVWAGVSIYMYIPRNCNLISIE